MKTLSVKQYVLLQDKQALKDFRVMDKESQDKLLAAMRLMAK